MATFSVSNLNDTGAGSLRDAITVANASAGPDEIIFDSGLSGTLYLTGGQIVITDALTITGPGRDVLTIDPEFNSRVFTVDDGLPDSLSQVVLQDLAFHRGANESVGTTGLTASVVANMEALTLNRTAILGNGAMALLAADGSHLIVENSIIENNGRTPVHAVGASVVEIRRTTVSGHLSNAPDTVGAILVGGGAKAYISHSEITGNAGRDAGGVKVYGGLYLESSLVAGNQGYLGTGGLLVYGRAEISNSTISGNLGRRGGGINARGSVDISASTVAANTAHYGGGVLEMKSVSLFNPSTITIENTLIAGNKATWVGDDLLGAATASYSLVESPIGAFIDGPDNLIGVLPQMGPLSDNGGPTATHALSPCSPAINAGSNTSGALYDQRGSDRGIGGRMDIGAFEFWGIAVDHVLDEFDGDFSAGDLSLREAISLPVSPPLPGQPARVVFHTSLTESGPATIDLLDELLIDQSLGVYGHCTGELTIDAGGQSRVVVVDDGDPFSSADVVIQGLTLRGGSSAENGGAIHLRGESLALSDVTISDNVAQGGGAISAMGGSLTINASHIAGNTASGDGGAMLLSGTDTNISGSSIANNSAQSRGGGAHVAVGTSLTFDGSSISGNGSGSHGGALAIAGHVTVLNTTLHDNLVAGDGGAIAVLDRGDLELVNTTVSGNTAIRSGGGIAAPYEQPVEIRLSTISNNSAGINGGGILSDLGQANDAQIKLYNSIVGDNMSSVGADASGWVGLYHSLLEDTNDSVVTGAAYITGVEPLLHPLADNGGTTLTQLLGAGSPAINAGDLSYATGGQGVPATDQRGGQPYNLATFDPYDAGPGFHRVLGGVVDMGATEYRRTLTVDTLVDGIDGDYSPGNFSFSEAIEAANLEPGFDTILFDTALFTSGPQTIVMSGSKSTRDITIAGPGKDVLTLTNGGFTLEYRSSVSGITMSGNFQGTAISSEGTLSLSDIRIENHGQAVRHQFGGTLEVSDSIVSGNSSALVGGGVYAHAGVVTVRNARIENNFGRVAIKPNFGGGGGLAANGALASISDTVISGNTTRNGDGAGLLMNAMRGSKISDSTISGNVAELGIGGGVAVNGYLTIERTSVVENSAYGAFGRYGQGGGIHSCADLLISDSVVSSNTAERRGGGLFSQAGGVGVFGDAVIRSSRFSQNSAPDGAGVFGQGRVDVEYSLFDGNYGLALENATTVTNSTISGNEDGVLAQTIYNSTIVNNTNYGVHSGWVESSIVYGNGMDAGSFTQFEYSLIGDFNTGGYGNNLVGVDPILGPLSDNGGPTLTHALLTGSPAVNRGKTSAAPFGNPPPEFDQRGLGFTRTSGSRPDIGAFEVQIPNDADFDDDGQLAGTDIDALVSLIALGANDAGFDLTFDGLVDLADRDEWLALASAANLPPGETYQLGDANLDGVVDGQDFHAWNDHKFQSVAAWTQGDFNADGTVNGHDFLIWNANKMVTIPNPSPLYRQTLYVGERALARWLGDDDEPHEHELSLARISHP